MTKRSKPPMGKLEPGQPVMVVRNSNDMRGRNPEDEYLAAEVVKVARVWVDLKKAGAGDLPEWSIHRWRMRMDDQTEGTQYPGINARFLTMEQYEWEKTQTWALGVLDENGVRLDRDSRWSGREVELATILSEGA